MAEFAAKSVVDISESELCRWLFAQPRFAAFRRLDVTDGLVAVQAAEAAVVDGFSLTDEGGDFGELMGRYHWSRCQLRLLLEGSKNLGVH